MQESYRYTIVGGLGDMTAEQGKQHALQMLANMVGPIPDGDEHTFLVALTVHGKDREQAEARLLAELPDPTMDNPVECWWIAEDDRHDGSDNDSAVFVRKGNQQRGFYSLHGDGLTGIHNNPGRQRHDGTHDQPE